MVGYRSGSLSWLDINPDLYHGRIQIRIFIMVGYRSGSLSWLDIDPCLYRRRIQIRIFIVVGYRSVSSPDIGTFISSAIDSDLYFLVIQIWIVIIVDIDTDLYYGRIKIRIFIIAGYISGSLRSSNLNTDLYYRSIQIYFFIIVEDILCDQEVLYILSLL